MSAPNTEVVTIALPKNEARLLIPALLDRQLMIAADHREGRMTDTERAERFDANQRVVDRVRAVLTDGNAQNGRNGQ